MAAQRSATADQLTVYPTQRRIRGLLGGEPVVDSVRGVLVWEPGRALPLYAFPREDVDEALLQDSPAPADGAHRPASAWFALRGSPDANGPSAWTYDDPDLEDHVCFSWRALDQWMEEDEEVFGHARDPFHRVDAVPSSRRVRVELAGRLIAESSRPVLVFETGLPVRHYLPPADADGEVLRPSPSHTDCPYKGTASYHHVAIGDTLHEDLIWHYPEPLPAVAAIAGLMAPYGERADVMVDGERQGPPRRPGWASR